MSNQWVEISGGYHSERHPIHNYRLFLERVFAETTHRQKKTKNLNLNLILYYFVNQNKQFLYAAIHMSCH